MVKQEIFKSAMRSAGDIFGVFDYDGDTGYFYLHNSSLDQNRRVIAALRVLTGPADFADEDVEIQWTADETQVGLLIRRRLCAVIDCATKATYGGESDADQVFPIPPQIAALFRAGS